MFEINRKIKASLVVKYLNARTRSRFRGEKFYPTTADAIVRPGRGGQHGRVCKCLNARSANQRRRNSTSGCSTVPPSIAKPMAGLGLRVPCSPCRKDGAAGNGRTRLPSPSGSARRVRFRSSNPITSDRGRGNGRCSCRRFVGSPIRRNQRADAGVLCSAFSKKRNERIFYRSAHCSIQHGCRVVDGNDPTIQPSPIGGLPF